MSEGVFSLQQQLAARTRGAVRAVVLAGGKGTRLAPYTSVLPKPLMPIGDRSILELVLGQLRDSGIMEVTLCVGYLSHLIEAVLGHSRQECGVEITYVREEEALGTAAPLRLVDDLTSTFIAMNGDVLTTLDYRDLIRHHRRDRNVLTIATRARPIQIDYGVLHLGSNGSSNRVQAYVEKPKMISTVSMGIYALEPKALSYIPADGYFDFPDLVQALLDADEPVGAYQYEGMWFDIGRRDDYERAVTAWIDETSEGDTPASEVAAGTI
jgi:NDP-sugar pyrophosphorylase family protein